MSCDEQPWMSFFSLINEELKGLQRLVGGWFAPRAVAPIATGFGTSTVRANESPGWGAQAPAAFLEKLGIRAVSWSLVGIGSLGK